MDQPASPPDPPRSRHGVVGTLLFVGALGVTGTAAWLYLRRQQKRADAQTHDRLRSRAPQA